MLSLLKKLVDGADSKTEPMRSDSEVADCDKDRMIELVGDEFVFVSCSGGHQFVGGL